MARTEQNLKSIDQPYMNIPKGFHRQKK